MIINNSKSCLIANERFGHFHDGFIKKVEVSSGNKFCHEMPWEEKSTYANNKEKLLATSLCYFGGKLIKLVVHHNCYDWPNQPWNRVLIIYIPRASDILPNITKYVGVDIFDLSFEFEHNHVSLYLATHEIPPKDKQISIENCNIETLCTAPKVRIVEV